MKRRHARVFCYHQRSLIVLVRGGHPVTRNRCRGHHTCRTMPAQVPARASPFSPRRWEGARVGMPMARPQRLLLRHRGRVRRRDGCKPSDKSWRGFCCCASRVHAWHATSTSSATTSMRLWKVVKVSGGPREGSGFLQEGEGEMASVKRATKWDTHVALTALFHCPAVAAVMTSWAGAFRAIQIARGAYHSRRQIVSDNDGLTPRSSECGTASFHRVHAGTLWDLRWR